MRPLKHRLTCTGTGYHSGRHTPCTVSLTLHCSSHVGRTICSSGPARYVRGSRHGIVSIPHGRDDFGGQNTEAAPLPILVRSFPVRLRLCCGSLARACAPFIVELFAVCGLGRSPEVVRFRLVGVATARLPTPARVQRTFRALHPIGPVLRDCGPLPAGGFEMLLPSLTRFEPDGSAGLHGGVFPVRPHSRTERSPWDRIWGLLFEPSKDYVQKPPSNVASHSHGTTLYGTRA